MSIDAYAHAHDAGEAGAPLFFAFHGTGGDEQQLFGVARQLAPTAEIVAPRGDVSEHGAARFFRRISEGVYDMDDLARATEKMAGFVRAWKEANPGRRVMGLGYSNGANILGAVIAAQAELFDDVVLMHPYLPWEIAPNPGLKGCRALVTSGARDPICPPEATDALVAYLEAQGAEVVTERHPGGHELRQEELIAADKFLAAR